MNEQMYALEQQEKCLQKEANTAQFRLLLLLPFTSSRCNVDGNIDTEEVNEPERKKKRVIDSEDDSAD